MGDSPGSQDLLRAPLTIGFDFQRTTGPVIGAFLTALREKRVLGIRDTEGSVVCPPVEYDSRSGAPLNEMVEVGSEGTITSWSWVPKVREGQPLQTPHALAMIKLDGADTSMMNLIDAPGPDAVSTGARVRIRWAEDRLGLLGDIACFELLEDGSAEEGKP
jgi:uncharacterized OB-fold protein